MDFTEDEKAQGESEALAELMEYARKRRALDMRKRLGKPVPGEEPVEETADVGEEGLGEESVDPNAPSDEPILGVEAEGDVGGEELPADGGDDKASLLQALLEKLKGGA